MGNLRWLESFDHASAAHYAQKYDYFGAAIDAAGRNGSCAKATPAFPNIKKTFDNQATWTVGFAFQRPNAATDKIVGLLDGTTEQLVLNYDATLYRLEIKRGSTVLAATASGSLLAGVWYYLEFNATIHNTAGSYELRVNGETKLSGINQNTRNGTNNYANAIWMLGSQYSWIDDWYVCDGTEFLGDIKVVNVRPVAAGFYTQWTPSAGQNWQNVDEVPANDDTDYNATDVADNIDTYNLQDVTLTGSVKGALLSLRVRKDDAGTRTVAAVCRSAATDYLGASVNPSNSYAYLATQLYPTDPATGLPWTVSGLNAAEFGVKFVS